jgi:hypothetical protein
MKSNMVRTKILIDVSMLPATGCSIMIIFNRMGNLDLLKRSFIFFCLQIWHSSRRYTRD